MGLNLRKYLPYPLKSPKEKLASVSTQLAQLQRTKDRIIKEYNADMAELCKTLDAAILERKIKFCQDVANFDERNEKRIVRLREKLCKEKERTRPASVEIVGKGREFTYHMP